MAINIRFLADVADWLAGLGKSKDAVDDNAKGLEDLMKKAVELGRSVGKSSDEIADDFSKAFGIPLDRAKRAVEEVIEETEQLGAGARTASRKVEDGMSDAARSTDKVKDAAKKVGPNLTELGSIARDVLAGDFAGAAESALGSLGALAGLAGVGGAVGGALLESVGGLAEALLTEWSRFPEGVKAARDELTNALVEAGGAFEDAEIESRLRNIVSDTDKWTSANLIAQATGRDVSEVIATLAGVTGDADQMLKDWNKSWGELPGSVPLADIDNAGAALTGVAEAGGAIPERLAAVDGALANTKQASADAAAKYDDFRGKLWNPLPTPAPVKIRIDTSDYDNWTPRVKFATVFANAPRGVEQGG